MKKVFLIGFMGCGKSTVSNLMKENYNLTVIDTDDWIEQSSKMEIKDIFTKHGESYFRDLESEALNHLDNYDVIATGGGIIGRVENIKSMKTKGVIVYLDTSFEEIVNRLKNDATRPLWNENKLEEMKNLFLKRKGVYEKAADLIIDTNQYQTSEIINKIFQYIK